MEVITSLERTKVTNLSLFFWKDSEYNSFVPFDEGLFVFKISDNNVKETLLHDQDHTMATSNKALGTPVTDHCRRVIVNFKLDSLREGNLYFFAEDIIRKTKVFDPNTTFLLGKEVYDHIGSCFRFRVINTYVPDADHPSRLVFVADVAVNNQLEVGYNDDNNVNVTVDNNNDNNIVQNQELQRIIHNMLLLAEYTRFRIQLLISAVSNSLGSSEGLSDSNFTFLGENYITHLNTDNMEFIEVEDVEDHNEEEFNNVLGILEEHTKNNCKIDATKDIEEEGSRVAKRAKIVQEVAPKRGRLSKIKPTIELLKVEDVVEDEDSVCSICLEKMSSEVKNIKMVRCKHVFHGRCIFKWLPKKQSCPYCRSSSLAIVTL